MLLCRIEVVIFGCAVAGWDDEIVCEDAGSAWSRLQAYAYSPNMPFNLNIKVKMEPIEEIIIKYYIIEFHQKMDC